MKAIAPKTREIELDSIRIVVRRARSKPEHDALRESIKIHGLKQPPQVHDIRDKVPPSQRKRPDGGLYSYETARGGEGRIAACKDLGWKKIPVILVEVNDAELVGGTLAENFNREPLTWAQMAKLVKAELDSGMTAREVANFFCITPAHVEKLHRIASRTAQEVEQEVGKLTLRQAELVTQLPKDHQSIVIDVGREIPKRDITALVRKAKEVAEKDRGLSKTALIKSLEGLEVRLKRLRDQLKVARRDHACGPQNLVTLLADPKFRRACKSEGIPTAAFEKALGL